MLIINPRIQIPQSELRLSYARSSGPGGQNVNKVNSKAVLKWKITTSTGLPESVRHRFLKKYATRITTSGEIVISSDTHREQKRNAEDCRKRLATMLASVAKPPKKRKKTKPSRAARERRLESKKRQSQKKKNRRPKFD